MKAVKARTNAIQAIVIPAIAAMQLILEDFGRVVPTKLSDLKESKFIHSKQMNDFLFSRSYFSFEPILTVPKLFSSGNDR